uniref:Putative chymotrypsin 1 n=1 Tax=Corethrella appendiculata TaxID=1370023 RepID=U5ETW5_9DIPT
MKQKYLSIILLILVNYSLKVESIIGGRTARPNFAPYAVSIQSNGAHVCGGAIIDASHIISTAKCLKTVNINSVLVGTQKLSTNNKRITIQSSAITTHLNYNSTHGLNDIGLIKLAEPLTLSATIEKIDYNTAAMASGVVTTFVGWGSVVPNIDIFPNDLQVLYQKSLTNSDCRSIFIDDSSVNVGNICAYIQEGQTTCKRDHGSPLVANGKLIGLLTLNVQCTGRKPDVFVDIAYYSNWITQNLK